MKDKIENYLNKLIIKAVTSAFSQIRIEDRVGVAIEKLRFDFLPHGACWMCSLPLSRGRGYFMWMGKMFCTNTCLRKYYGLMQVPDGTPTSLKAPDGLQHPIEVFEPKV